MAFNALFTVDGITVWRLNDLIERPEHDDITIMTHPSNSWMGWAFSSRNHQYVSNNFSGISKESIGQLTITEVN